MSLDIDLKREKWVSYYSDFTDPVKECDIVFSKNITHNLGLMAGEAGLYLALWRPHRLTKGFDFDEYTYEKECEFENSVEIRASFIIEYLEKGLSKLKENPEFFKVLNPSNGWGKYEGLVNFTEKYLEACIAYPDSIIEVSR